MDEMLYINSQWKQNREVAYGLDSNSNEKVCVKQFGRSERADTKPASEWKAHKFTLRHSIWVSRSYAIYYIIKERYYGTDIGW